MRGGRDRRERGRWVKENESGGEAGRPLLAVRDAFRVEGKLLGV